MSNFVGVFENIVPGEPISDSEFNHICPFQDFALATESLSEPDIREQEHIVVIALGFEHEAAHKLIKLRQAHAYSPHNPFCIHAADNASSSASVAEPNYALDQLGRL